jgi:transposase
LVDGLGNPLHFLLTGGQRQDLSQAAALLTGYDSQYVIADKGYDSSDLIHLIVERDSIPVIPPRSNRTQPREYDQQQDKERHLVECCINKLKHYRRIFSRFEKLASRYLGFLKLAATLIWLR